MSKEFLVAAVFDAWGFERCLWGTDWTRTSAVVNYEHAALADAGATARIRAAAHLKARERSSIDYPARGAFKTRRSFRLCLLPRALRRAQARKSDDTGKGL